MSVEKERLLSSNGGEPGDGYIVKDLNPSGGADPGTGEQAISTPVFGPWLFKGWIALSSR